MNIDIRLDTSWRNHKKRWRVYDAAGNDGVQAIEDLWLYAATYCPTDGILRDMTESDIVRAAQYTGGKNIVGILVDERFLDRIKNGKKITYALHNWKKWQGYLCESEKRTKAAKKAAKAKWDKVKKDMRPESEAHCGKPKGALRKLESGNAPSLSFPAPDPSPKPDLKEARVHNASTGISTDSTRKGLQSVQDVFSRIAARQKTKAGAQ